LRACARLCLVARLRPAACEHHEPSCIFQPRFWKIPFHVSHRPAFRSGVGGNLLPTPATACSSGIPGIIVVKSTCFLASFPLWSLALEGARSNSTMDWPMCQVKSREQHVMKNNEEKPSYALDPLIVRDWELKANGIRLEELLAAYAQQQRSDIQALEWFTATNTMIGIAYTYGLHPNAPAGRPYDGVWKREYVGGGSVIVAYTEEPQTCQIYVGILWQRRRLHHPTMPVLAVPRGYTQMPEQGELFARQSKEVVEHLHDQTALLELTEEMVKGAIHLDMLEPLGPPATSNNADVDTLGEGEGVYFYRIELPWSYLEAESPDTLRLKAGLEATQGVVEGILRCQFMPIQRVLELLDDPDNPAAGCFFTEVAIGRLTRYLQRQGYPDRKSTRLNSSHLGISYAVFCLKKKKINKTTKTINTRNNVETPASIAPGAMRVPTTMRNVYIKHRCTRTSSRANTKRRANYAQQ